ncbi:MAG: hypothetical protein ACOYJQ_11630 [Pseudochelatococcus sp.]|jgi:hypothetical protein|uniref:hypothetical protein n=1 Tax=Pseudochelatococcus sp. TaxID=2020869 RepID=UPI003D9330B8
MSIGSVPPGGIDAEYFGREISAENVNSLKGRGLVSDFLHAVDQVWEKIRDYFSDTHVGEAKGLLREIFSEDLDSGKRLESFKKLQQLAGLSHASHFSADFSESAPGGVLGKLMIAGHEVTLPSSVSRRDGVPESFDPVPVAVDQEAVAGRVGKLSQQNAAARNLNSARGGYMPVLDNPDNVLSIGTDSMGERALKALENGELSEADCRAIQAYEGAAERFLAGQENGQSYPYFSNLSPEARKFLTKEGFAPLSSMPGFRGPGALPEGAQIRIDGKAIHLSNRPGLDEDERTAQALAEGVFGGVCGQIEEAGVFGKSRDVLLGLLDGDIFSEKPGEGSAVIYDVRRDGDGFVVKASHDTAEHAEVVEVRIDNNGDILGVEANAFRANNWDNYKHLFPEEHAARAKELLGDIFSPKVGGWQSIRDFLELKRLAVDDKAMDMLNLDVGSDDRISLRFGRDVHVSKTLGPAPTGPVGREEIGLSIGFLERSLNEEVGKRREGMEPYMQAVGRNIGLLKKSLKEEKDPSARMLLAVELSYLQDLENFWTSPTLSAPKEETERFFPSMEEHAMEERAREVMVNNGRAASDEEVKDLAKSARAVLSEMFSENDAITTDRGQLVPRLFEQVEKDVGRASFKFNGQEITELDTLYWRLSQAGGSRAQINAALSIVEQTIFGAVAESTYAKNGGREPNAIVYSGAESATVSYEFEVAKDKPFTVKCHFSTPENMDREQFGVFAQEYRPSSPRMTVGSEVDVVLTFDREGRLSVDGNGTRVTVVKDPVDVLQRDTPAAHAPAAANPAAAGGVPEGAIRV